MRIVKKIRVNTYNCNILFVLTNEMAKSEKHLQKKYAKGTLIPGTAAEEAEGITITVDGSLYITMIDVKYLNHNTIGHELFHATKRIAEDRDITDEESCAWLMGFLCEEFYKFLGSERVKLEFEKVDNKNGKEDNRSK
jgi:hypothetical protein